MGIMARIIRLCRADIHGVLDQMEDKSLLLKQYMREMNDELERLEERSRQLLQARDQAGRESERLGREFEKLERDVTSALEKDREDLARMLIRKKKPIGKHLEELDRHLASLDTELTELNQLLDERRLQLKKVKLRSDEYFRSIERRKWEQGLASSVSAGLSGNIASEEVEWELMERKAALKGGT